jgi:hypothetical protein
MTTADDARQFDGSVASRRVYKYGLILTGQPQIVHLPHGAEIVHVAVQNVDGEPHPMLWALVSTTAPHVARTFYVLATGQDVPVGACYVGTIHIDWTVWHIVESVR